MTPDPCCVLSLDQVDELQAATHRIRLRAHLLISVLEGQWTEGDLINEGLSELATATIAEAAAIMALVAEGGLTARAVRATRSTPALR